MSSALSSSRLVTMIFCSSSRREVSVGLMRARFGAGPAATAFLRGVPGGEGRLVSGLRGAARLAAGFLVAGSVGGAGGFLAMVLDSR